MTSNLKVKHCIKTWIPLKRFDAVHINKMVKQLYLVVGLVMIVYFHTN